MQGSDFSEHPVVRALTDAIETLTCLREQGVKTVPVDGAVWQAFCAAPQRVAMPQVAAPGAAARGGGGATADTPEQRQAAMGALRHAMGSCRGCRFAEYERFVGRGNLYNPEVALVTGPFLMGDDAAAQGSRLVPGGAAEELLAKMFGVIQLPLASLYITPVLKCGIPRGRVELTALRTCAEQLKKELRLVNPKVVVLLGPMAAQALFPASPASVGQVGQWNMIAEGHLPTLTMHHPMRILMLDEKVSRPLRYENLQALKALRAYLDAH